MIVVYHSNMNTHLQRASKIVTLMDKRYLDPILGLIPGVGDILSLAISSYLVWIAIVYRLPASAILLMVWNVAIDFVVGTIPVVGDVADFFYHANSKNMDILKRHMKYFGEVEEGEVIS